MNASVSGPDFIALQVRDVEAAAQFYESQLGLTRAPAAPPGAVVFTTSPIPFAVREPLPGIDLASGDRPGNGVALWLRCDDAQALHDSLAEALAAADVRAAFDALAPSKRKEHVRQVTSAKAEEIRDRRIAKIVDSLR